MTNTERINLIIRTIEGLSGLGLPSQTINDLKVNLETILLDILEKDLVPGQAGGGAFMPVSSRDRRCHSGN